MMIVGADEAGRLIEVGFVEAADEHRGHRPRHASPTKALEVTTMGRRSTEDIISDAEALADRFERWEPTSGRSLDGAPIRAVHQAFQNSAKAQRELSEAVAQARAGGFSW